MVHTLDTGATKRCKQIHESVPATVSASADIATSACSPEGAATSSLSSAVHILATTLLCWYLDHIVSLYSLYSTATVSSISDLMLDVVDTV